MTIEVLITTVVSSVTADVSVATHSVVVSFQTPKDANAAVLSIRSRQPEAAVGTSVRQSATILNGF